MSFACSYGQMCRRPDCGGWHNQGRIVDTIREIMTELLPLVMATRSQHLRLERLVLFCHCATPVVCSKRNLPASGEFLKRLMKRLIAFYGGAGRYDGDEEPLNLLQYCQKQVAAIIEEARTDSYERFVQPVPANLAGTIPSDSGVVETLTIVAGASCAVPELLSLARLLYKRAVPSSLDALAYAWFAMADAAEYLYARSEYVEELEGRRVDAWPAIIVREMAGVVGGDRETVYDGFYERIRLRRVLQCYKTLYMSNTPEGEAVRKSCSQAEGPESLPTVTTRQVDSSVRQLELYWHKWEQLMAEKVGVADDAAVVRFLEVECGLTGMGLRVPRPGARHLAAALYNTCNVLEPQPGDTLKEIRSFFKGIVQAAPWILWVPEALEESTGVRLGHTSDLGVEADALRAVLHELVSTVEHHATQHNAQP